MSVAACIGLSQILLTLIACPQFLQIMEVPPAMVLVLMYMPQDYASIAGRAEGIGTATTDFGCCVSSNRREARKGESMLRAAISGSRNLQISSFSALFV
jgi:hypothetical protein